MFLEPNVIISCPQIKQTMGHGLANQLPGSSTSLVPFIITNSSAPPPQKKNPNQCNKEFKIHAFMTYLTPPRGPST